MKVFNYSEARQNFSTLLNAALKEEVIITRKDGSKFKLISLHKNEKKTENEQSSHTQLTQTCINGNELLVMRNVFLPWSRNFSKNVTSLGDGSRNLLISRLIASCSMPP